MRPDARRRHQESPDILSEPRRYRLRDLVDQLGDAEIVGDAQIEVTRVASLKGADRTSIAFLHRADYQDQLAQTQAGAVILRPAHRALTDITRIVTADPYAYFARMAALLHPATVAVPGVHPSAVIDSSAQIDPSACVGALAVIGARARIAANVTIGAGCSVGPDCQIGRATRLHARVTLYDRVQIGERGIFHSGCVLGSDGFGFAPAQGKWIKIPQIGGVVIGDDVELGANTAVDRGALDDTVIGNGVKVDNLVQIAHNCRIGDHTVIAGNTGIAGSTQGGAHCIIGGASTLAGHLVIADGTTIAGGTTITRSIAQADTYVGVFPFDKRSDWLRNSAHLRSLDALVRRVKRLETLQDSTAAKDS